MSPVERAEALLADVVSILYSAFWANDFPESYIRSLVPAKIRERLHELRIRAQNPPSRVEPPPRRSRSPREDLDFQPSDEGYRRMIALADRRLAEAVDALCEVDTDFAERYLEAAAQRHMAACLRWRREQETPSERTAIVEEVNTLREGVELGPLTWEQVVTDLPQARLLRRGVGERREPGDRHLPRSISWRYPELFQGDSRRWFHPAPPWRRPGATARRRRPERHS